MSLPPSASSRRGHGACRIAPGPNTSAWALSHSGSATRGGLLRSLTGLPSGVLRASRATPYPQHRPPSHRARASSRSSPNTVRLAFPSCTDLPIKATIHPTSEEWAFSMRHFVRAPPSPEGAGRHIWTISACGIPPRVPTAPASRSPSATAIVTVSVPKRFTMVPRRTARRNSSLETRRRP